MVYKKFIKRGSSATGPYFYTSARNAQGKVKSIYLGSDYKKALEKEIALREERQNETKAKSAAIKTPVLAKQEIKTRTAVVLPLPDFSQPSIQPIPLPAPSPLAPNFSLHYEFIFIFIVAVLILGATMLPGGISGFAGVTGFFAKAPAVEISNNVLEELNQTGEARVIVVLKEPEEQTPSPITGAVSARQLNNSERLELRKAGIKQKQDKIISKLENKEQIIEGVKNAKKAKKFKLNQQYTIVSGFAATIGADELEQLKQDPDVLAVYIDEPVSISLSDSVPLINANKVWNLSVNGVSINGSGQTVCEIDTGIELIYNNSAFGYCNNVAFLLGYCKVVAGYDFVNFDTLPADDNGHGTHVAGIIASMDSTYRGVAPGAKLIAMKVLDDEGNGYTSAIDAAIQTCTSNAAAYNISVISMSLGEVYNSSSACDSHSPTTASAINLARAAGIIVMVASGNAYLTTGIAAPSCIANATSVGSTTKSDGVSSFTNRAQNLDILAPGSSITSTYLGSTFATMSGTSMATPHASGVAALMYQRELLLNNKKANPAAVEALLKQTGKPIYDSGTGLTFPRIDVLAAVNRILRTNDTENSAWNDYGKVAYSTSTNMSSASAVFIFSTNSIYANTSGFAQYNKLASITFYTISYQKTPIIFKDGTPCYNPNCNVTGTSPNTIVSVSGFSNYTTAPSSKLVIWDSSDVGMPYFIGTPGIGDTANIYANYTNRTSGATISAGACDLNFTDSYVSMTYNATKLLFEYSRSFSTPGGKPYTINCSNTVFEPLTVSDSVGVSCNYQNSGTPWIISGGDVVNCAGQTFVINQSDVVVNGVLLVENSTFVFENAANKAINVSETANFTMKNAVFQGSISSRINLRGYGDFANTLFNRTILYVLGNKTHSLNNATFYAEAHFGNQSNNAIINSSFKAGAWNYFEQNSVNTILNSDFGDRVILQHSAMIEFRNSRVTGNTYFNDNSSTTIQNTNLSTVYVRIASAGYASPIINFTQPKSNITSSISVGDIGTPTATLSGYVDVPATGSSITSGTLRRYFPVRAVDKAGRPLQGRILNVTDSSGNQLNTTLTDANGTAIVNVTLDSTHYGPGNFTVKLNPEENLSLFTDTPITMDADVYPVWSNNKTNFTSPATYSPTASYQFNITWDDDVGISSVWFEHNFIGSAVNDSRTGSAGNESYFNYGALKAGSYYWKSWANDTLNQWNGTDVFGFVINPAAATLALSSQNGWSHSYGTQTNVSCTANAAQVTPLVTLFRNDTGSVGTPNNAVLAAGSYNYICNVSSSPENYTIPAQQSNILNINQIVTYVNLSLNGAENNATLTHPQTLTAIFSTNAFGATMYRNGINVSNENNTVITLAANATPYNYTVINPGNQNYTASSKSFFVTVQKNVTTTELRLNGARQNLSMVYPAQINASATTSALPGQLQLLRNGTNKNAENGIYVLLAAGHYNYTAINPGNENYTSSNETWFLEINKSLASCSLTFNPAAQPQNYTQSLTVNASCSCTNPETSGAATLWRDGNNVTVAENNKFAPLAAKPAGYSYVCNASATQNYSYANTSASYTINKANPPQYLNITLNGGETNLTMAYGTQSNATGRWMLPNSQDLVFNLSKNGANANSENGLLLTLAAGEYYYAYNTTGGENYTAGTSPMRLLNVTKTSSTLTLNITPSTTVTYNTTTTANCTSSAPQVLPQLYRDGILISGAYESLVLAAKPAGYNYSCNATGNENYTMPTPKSSILTINQTNTTTELRLNGDRSNKSVIYGAQTNATANTSVLSLTLYRNGAPIGTNSIISDVGVLAAGNYTYNATNPGNENYTASQELWTLQVNKSATYVNLSLNSAENDTTLIYPQQLTASFSTNNLSATMYRDGIDKSGENNIATTLAARPASAYNYTVINTGNENYTASSKTFFVTADKNTTTTDLKLNGAHNNLTLTYPQQVNASAVTSALSVILLRNGTNKDSENGIYISLTAGSYNYSANNPGNENYTASNDTLFLTMQKNSTSCALNFTPAGSTAYNNSVNASCSCTNPEASAELWRDGFDKTGAENNQFTLLAAKPAGYGYVCNVSETQNYTAATTGTISYAISQATTLLNITGTGTFKNGTATSVNCAANTGQVAPQLFRDGNFIASPPDALTLDIADYTYICNSTATENYTAATESKLLRITALDVANCTLSFDKTSPQNYTPSFTLNASCSCDNPETGLTLWRAGNNVTAAENNQQTSLPAGNHNYVCNTSRTLTYEYAEDSLIFVVNKSASIINLTLNGFDSDRTIERKSSVTINATLLNPASGAITLYLDSLPISSGFDSLQNTTTWNSLSIHNYTTTYSATENYSAASKTHLLTVQDTIPPAGVSGLANISRNLSWIYWNWTNPTNDDFNHTEIWINGVWKLNTTATAYNATGLARGTNYTIQTKTADNYNNTNATWVNNTATTQANSLPTAPTINLTPLPAHTDDSIVCNITTNSTDADNDGVNYTFKWHKNGTLNATSGPFSTTYNTLSSSVTAKGEKWNCTVTPYDGYANGTVVSANLTIQNSAPTTNGTISSQSWDKDTNKTINIAARFIDADLDDLNYTTTQPANITATINNATGNVTFVPNAGWTGTTSIIFTARDTDGASIAGNNVTLQVSTPTTTPTGGTGSTGGSGGGGGGGGSGGGYEVSECVERWVCGDWSECSADGIQTRKCDDFNFCETNLTKPNETMSCNESLAAGPQAGEAGQTPVGEIPGKIPGGSSSCAVSWLFIALAVVCVLLCCGASYWSKKKESYETGKKLLKLLSYLFAFAAIGLFAYAYFKCNWIGTLVIGAIALIIMLFSIYKERKYK